MCLPQPAAPPPPPHTPTEELGGKQLRVKLAGESAPCCRRAAAGTQLLRGGAPDPTLPAAIYQKLKITQE